MQVFRLVPDEFDRTSQYEIEATHEFSVPGVTCHVCGSTWAVTGLSYPHITLPETIDARAYQRVSPVPLEDFVKLKGSIEPLLPPDAPVLPGTEFGRLVGDVSDADSSDFLWLNPWTLLTRQNVSTVLQRSIPQIITVATLLREGGELTDLVEVVAMTLGELATDEMDELDAVACSGCGRRSVSVPDRIVTLIPAGITIPPIFRLSGAPTVMLASKELIAVIQSLGLRGVAAEAVDVLPL